MKKQSGALKIKCVFLSLAFIMSACTKEHPYKKQYKDQVYNKLDENVEYLLTTSTGITSRTSEDKPYWMGEPRIVKLKYTEKTLQVIEVEQDERFQTNKTNNKVVLEMPITHLSYRCAKDDNGQCTNKEEEVTDVNWSKKPSFKPDVGATKMVSADSATVEFDKLFGSTCYSEEAASPLEFKIEKDAFNIQIEKTYRINIDCISQIDSFEDLFTKTIANTVVHHSLVKLDSIASKNFQARAYTPNETNTFGFFDQMTRTLDIDYRATVDTEKSLISRWNPERTQIDYYLSDEFAKPENKLLKDASYVGVEKLNAGLKLAGAKFQIVLHEPAGKQPGDIRNSMIVMVEDPIASGLLGYGPSVKNPRTGEILSARTVMYPGVMRQQVMMTYNELYNKLRKDNSLKIKLNNLEVDPNLSSITPTINHSKEAAKIASTSKLANVKVLKKNTAKASPIKLGSASFRAELNKANNKLNKISFNTAEIKSAKEATSIEEGIEQVNKKELFKSRNCFYPVGSFEAGSEIEDAIIAKLGKIDRPWHELNKSEQQIVIDIIMPASWISTLVHEMGHNLGLRHNFEGSNDKDNFYSQEELAKMGINHKIPYSSVMDYSASSLNDLPALGKYDVAALRFAYANKVAVVDAQGQESLVNVETSLDDLQKGQLKLKKFGYCTDENTGINATCNRFDEGTNYTEIVQFMINEYHNRQFYLNRLDRRSFSVGDDLTYLSGVQNRMLSMRGFFESYERMKDLLGNYGMDIDGLEDPTYVKELLDSGRLTADDVAFFKDIRTAAVIAGKFFVEELQIPDTTCAIAKSDAPNKIIMLLPLKAFDKSSLSCFDAGLNSNYVIVAEGGKSLNSKKSPDSDNAYADQIDLRGIWGNKILAAHFLFTRKLGLSTYDKISDNFTDMPDLAQDIFDVTAGLASNNLVVNTTFRTASGQELVIPVQNELESNLIDAPLYSFISRAMGLPARATYLQEAVLPILTSNMITTPLKLSVANAEFSDAFKVTYGKATETDKNLDDSVEYIDLGDTRIIASKLNLVASDLIVSINNGRILNELGPDKVKEILLLKMSEGVLDEKAPDNEKRVFNMDTESLVKFVRGSYPQESDSLKLLSFLPAIK